MKKVLFIAAVSLICLTSCKKDWTCTCNYGGYTFSDVIEDSKKADAEADCQDAETALKFLYSSASCDLK